VNFGSFVRGEAIAKMSEWRRKGVRRSDLKIIASDPELAAIAKALAGRLKKSLASGIVM
jgi:hypothetical protein